MMILQLTQPHTDIVKENGLGVNILTMTYDITITHIVAQNAEKSLISKRTIAHAVEQRCIRSKNTVDEYICKADAIDDLHTQLMYRMGSDDMKRRLDDWVKTLPSADVVQVVHGHWVKTADGAECDNCGREAVYQIIDGRWQYEPWCPHCGAIMDNKRGNKNG